jgi:CRISPR-associated protein Csm3
MTTDSIKLYGRILLEGDIEALTGLHIGGSPGALSIGGVDLPVIRNAVDQAPYIPGSSLKGKMRSLWEKATGAKQNRSIGKGVTIHACEKKEEYEHCPVCQIFGTLGQNDAAFPTRIVVRDVPLAQESLKDVRTDMPFTEVKWEAAIDRVTSAATPRQIERVPAKALFSQMQIVFNIYEQGDIERFLDVLTSLQLVEDDYLGGQGSRGSGRVAFRNLTLTCKSTGSYEQGDSRALESLSDGHSLLDWMQMQIPTLRTGGR